MKNPLPNIRHGIKKLWNYVSVIWEGKDHKPSYRRVGQLMMLILIWVMVTKDQTQTQYGFYTFLGLCGLFLILAAIISVEHLMEAWKIYNHRGNSAADKDKPE